MDEHLREQIEQLKEDLFLAQSDLETSSTQNIVLKNFIQNIYESCDGIEDDSLELNTLLKNLKENIRVFAKANNIRL